MICICLNFRMLRALPTVDCTSRENRNIALFTDVSPQSSLVSNHSGNSLSFNNDKRLFPSFSQNLGIEKENWNTSLCT